MVGEQAKARIAAARSAQGARAKIAALVPGVAQSDMVRQLDATTSGLRARLGRLGIGGRRMDVSQVVSSNLGFGRLGNQRSFDGTAQYTSLPGRWTDPRQSGFTRLR